MKQRTIQVLSIALFVVSLVWGIGTLILYVGVPGHSGILLSDELNSAVGAACGADDRWCRGLEALWPFLKHTVQRAAPFQWYGFWSVVFFGLFLGWQKLRTGRCGLHLSVRPWHIITLFLLSLWVLFSSLSSMDVNGVTMRRLIEPTEKVYSSSSPQAMAYLRDNFNELQERGCLRLRGQAAVGVAAYDLKTRCVQQAFFTRVLPPLLYVMALLLLALAFGRGLLVSVFRFRPHNLLHETVVSLGLGLGGMIILLWTLAVVGIYTVTMGWILATAITLLSLGHILIWLRRLHTAVWDVEIPWWSPLIALFWFLITYAAFNFLSVVRPFPIGWDDLGSYLNRPRQLVSYGHFLHSMAPFQWEYLTSLGFLFTDFSSWTGATLALETNWMAGVFAILLMYTFARTFFGKGAGLLSAVLYYSLPMVGHFSFADMKIDNATLAFSALAALCVFLFLFPRDGEQRNVRWMLLAGVFGGLSFGIKATAIMLILGLGSVAVGVLLHWSAFLSAMLLSLFVIINKATSLNRLFERLTDGAVTISSTTFLILCAVPSLILLAFACGRRPRNVLPTAKACALFGLGFFLMVGPWVAHNNILSGDSIFGLRMGAPNTISPKIDLYGNAEKEREDQVVRSLPPELIVDREQCNPTGHLEELDRYWGFEKGVGHYLTLPWRTVMNSNSAGYYVTTMAALLLFPLLLLLPYFWSDKGRWLKWLTWATVLTVLQWMFVANGIPWYGLGAFVGLIVGLEALVVRSPDTLSRTVLSVLIFLSILSNTGMRIWQFEGQRNTLEYTFGKITAPALQERTIAHYDDIARLVVQRHRTVPDRPYLYRVGTFIPYFIPQNAQIIAATDHQLDLFNCLHQERDNAKTLARLKALGFNSIIFDTNTATIERDPNGTLHQKVNAFVEFLNTAGLQAVVNDPGAGVAFLLIP